ncbi:MAG: NADH-quinone oxidoreductase subunit L [Pseudomonadales bacterium]
MSSSVELLAWIPVLPLVGFLILVVSEGRLGKLAVAVIGSGSVGGSALITLLVSRAFVESGQDVFVHTLWQWMDVGSFNPAIRLYFDGLAMVMVGVITCVGFLIHLYATGYMAGEEDYSRFFAYMNLFVFAMLMLVLGDNLLVLYLGWEGVGLCSYLLIGFFHTDAANGYAARKAFVVTRVGDTAMAFGLFLLFRELGTIEIQTALQSANASWPNGSDINTLIALLLLGGAAGKSAQVPLQTWLPDAMAGPTPVSALIHAATMVTAGVYLIARMHDVFLLSSTAQMTVACIGLITLFISAFSALTQRDLKRILAYSTMSQIGYMFFALGVGAWSAAVFHLMTHAFFKALLFLSAGSVILALHHEQDVFRMGGLRRKLPIPFSCMLVGSAALAALPLTSGFYSKDVILLTSFDHGSVGPLFWSIASLAAFVTSLYSARMIFLVFFGAEKTEPHDNSGWNMTVPLLMLAALALGGGWFGLAAVAPVLPDGGMEHGEHATWLVWLTAMIPIAGVALGCVLYGLRRTDSLADLSQGEPESGIAAFLRSGWGFDGLYDALMVKPFVAIAQLLKSDPVDAGYSAMVVVARLLHKITAATQSGQLRWYAASMGVGFAVVLILAVTVV